jgi:hypothetical protein
MRVRVCVVIATRKKKKRTKNQFLARDQEFSGQDAFRSPRRYPMVNHTVHKPRGGLECTLHFVRDKEKEKIVSICVRDGICTTYYGGVLSSSFKILICSDIYAQQTGTGQR